MFQLIIGLCLISISPQPCRKQTINRIIIFKRKATIRLDKSKWNDEYFLTLIFELWRTKLLPLSVIRSSVFMSDLLWCLQPLIAWYRPTGRYDMIRINWQGLCQYFICFNQSIKIYIAPLKGAVHKVRHAIFHQFYPCSPLSHFVTHL